MANKMTKRDYFAMIKAELPKTSANYSAMTEFIDHEIELLDKKSTSRKLTPAQIENEKRMEALITELEFNKRYTITEMREKTEAFKGLSSQRATALVGIMINQNKLVREMEKGVAYFSLVEGV